MAYKYSKGFSVQGDIKAADDAQRDTLIDFGEDQIDFQTSGSVRLRIENDHITTMLPVLISGSAVEGLRVAKGGSDYRAIVFEVDGQDNANISVSNAENFVIQNEMSGKDIQFWVKPAAGSVIQAMTIEEDGKIGIGITAPSHKLDIDGDIRVRGNDIRDNSGNPAISFDGSANTMIVNDLEIDGNTNISGSLTVGGSIETTSDISFQSGGNETLKIASGGAITFNQAYTFPTSDGTSGQALQTDGAGNLTFASVSGGGSATPDDYEEIKLVDPNYSTGDEANRSFTIQRHYDFSIGANTWTDVISWRPYLAGTTTDPTGVLHAAVSYRMEIAGLQNGVANGYRSRKGFVSYEGSSAANDFSSDTTMGSGPMSARVVRSGWVATLQINANSGGAAGFRGSVYVEVSFPRGGGSNGTGIVWDVT